MKTVEEIHYAYKARKRDLGPMHATAAEVEAVYNGTVQIPLPEMDENEKAATANLIQSALDQTAMRVASTFPAMDWPALRKGIKKSEQFARIRKHAVMDWHEKNQLARKMGRRARWCVGYGTGPAQIRWGKVGNEHLPLWHPRSPLQTFPAPGLDPDELHPPDCIFAIKRSREWVRANFPDQFARLRRFPETKMFQILEYIDEFEIVLCVVGDEGQTTYDNEIEGWSEVETLVRTPNRAGMPTVVIPGRITLAGPMGQFDGAVGIWQAQARMFALLQIAVERSIFPEEWIVSPEGGNAQVVNEPDARTGVHGKIKGGDIKIVQPQPGVFAMNLHNEFEDAIRSFGAPAQYSGQAPSNNRTARAANSTLSNAVDFYIQEYQTTLEQALKIENKIAVATAKGYAGNTPKTFFMNGTKSEYTPNVHFETDEHVVRYAFAGADMDGQIIAGGQRVGMGTLSKRGFMAIDPMVRDVDSEMNEIMVERLREAFLASIQQQAADPMGPFQPAELAELIRAVRSGEKELEDAVAELQQKVQERQAEQQAAQAPGPEGQPGLSVPGAPGAPPEAIAEVQPSVANLTNTLGKLRLAQMKTGAER